MDAAVKMLVCILLLSLALKLKHYDDSEVFPLLMVMMMLMTRMMLMVVVMIMMTFILECLSVLSRACNNFLMGGENYHSSPDGSFPNDFTSLLKRRSLSLQTRMIGAICISAFWLLSGDVRDVLKGFNNQGFF